MDPVPKLLYIFNYFRTPPFKNAWYFLSAVMHFKLTNLYNRKTMSSQFKNLNIFSYTKTKGLATVASLDDNAPPLNLIIFLFYVYAYIPEKSVNLKVNSRILWQPTPVASIRPPSLHLRTIRRNPMINLENLNLIACFTQSLIFSLRILSKK